MQLMKKIPDTKKSSSNLDEILKKEKAHDDKMYAQGEKYYHSEEAKIKGKEIYNLQKEYIKNNPQDYAIQGINIQKLLWYRLPEYPKNEQKIFELTGKGKCHEVHGEYEKAIEYYKKAENLTLQVCNSEINQMIEEYGPGDYLYLKAIRQRIRVCNKKVVGERSKKLESEAKELEKTNPAKAIEIYNELNNLKPGLKKYNKRIEICKKKLE